MADENERQDAAQKAGSGVTRTIANVLVLLASLAVLIAWVANGFYQLKPGNRV